MKLKPPYFVFKPDSYTNNLASLKSAFKERMGRLKVGYSVKTNSHPLVLKTALDNGCYAEVVSPYEYEKARDAGFGADKIIYNGVCKDIDQACACCAEAGIVNVDSIDELIEIYNRAKRDIYIGVRLTFDIGNGVVSRFGIPTNSRDFQILLEIDKNNEHIHIVGLSCHITHARDVESWRLRAKTMTEKARMFKNIRYIDLGGNMYSPMDSIYAKNFPDHVTFAEYADAILPELEDLDCDLILETGTPLVANAMDLVCEVIGVKKNKGKTFIIVNTSSYDIGIVCRNTALSYDVIRRGDNTSCFARDAIVVGYTCIEDDVICKNFSSDISIGDEIIFHNVGAYSYSFASDFIMPKHSIIEEREKMIKC